MKFLIPCCAIAALSTVSLLSSTASAQLFSRFSAPSQRYSPPSQRYSAPSSPYSVAPYNYTRHSNSYSAPNYSNGGTRFTPATYPAPQQKNYGHSYSQPSHSNQGQAGPTLVPTPAGSSRPAYSQNYAAQPQTYSAPRKS